MLAGFIRWYAKNKYNVFLLVNNIIIIFLVRGCSGNDDLLNASGARRCCIHNTDTWFMASWYFRVNLGMHWVIYNLLRVVVATAVKTIEERIRRFAHEMRWAAIAATSN